MKNSFVLILVFLAVQALAQSCDETNSTDPALSNLLPSQFIVGNVETSSKVSLCTCPTGSTVSGITCECTGANQFFDSESCICDSTYLLVDGACVLCQYPCSSCDAAGACLNCSTGHVLNADGICEAVATGVSGVTLHNSAVYECASGGCSSCTFGGPCASCADVYYLNGTECASCENVGTNCKTCTAEAGCTTCYKGYYLSGTDCEPCPANCLDCDGSVCTACEDGYYASGNTCTTCTDKYCTSCPSDVCSACRNGYTLIVDECVQCLVGCTICSGANISVCYGCAEGYY